MAGRGAAPPARWGPGGGHEPDPTRDLILRAARRLFMERGYRAVTTRQVADACGLTQPALYYHFAGKRELYAAVLRDELSPLGADLRAIVADDAPLEDRLCRTAAALMAGEARDHALILHDIRTELDAATRARVAAEFAASVIAPLAALFAGGQRAGILRAVDAGGLAPERAAWFLLALVAQARRPDAGDPPEAVARLMLHGLAAP
jgi:AcrR family transcriptional regulator